MREFFELEDLWRVLAEFMCLGDLDPSELEREIVVALGTLLKTTVEG